MLSNPDFPVPMPQIQGYAGLVQNKLDHRNLNDLFDEAPTMEAMVRYVQRNWLGPDPVSIKVWRPTLGVSAEWVRK